MTRPTELKLEEELENYWIENSIQVKRQVRYFQKRIDIVTLDYRSSQLAAIEIKVSDWKGGLRQAYVNKTICSNSYLALWHKHASRAIENTQLFNNLGVGLIIINSEYKPETVIYVNEVKDNIVSIKRLLESIEYA